MDLVLVRQPVLTTPANDMGAGASTLHEDDYKHFLELSESAQQNWLRQIPSSEISELLARSSILASSDQIQILNSVRNVKSRGAARPVRAQEIILDEQSTVQTSSNKSIISVSTVDKMDSSAVLSSNRSEILDSMIQVQKDSNGVMNSLSLIDLGLEFSVPDIGHVLTSWILSVNLSRNNQLSGSLSSFSPCVMLIDICLENTAIVGDISAFSACTKLQKVLLSGLDITGNIAVFENAPSLKKVWLRETKVTGSIERAFKKSYFLLDVFLRRTNVSGNIKVFAKCFRLKNLSLSRTKVIGCVEELGRCHVLQTVALEFCEGITGSKKKLEKVLPDCTISF